MLGFCHPNAALPSHLVSLDYKRLTQHLVLCCFSFLTVISDYGLLRFLLGSYGVVICYKTRECERRQSIKYVSYSTTIVLLCYISLSLFVADLCLNSTEKKGVHTSVSVQGFKGP